LDWAFSCRKSAQNLYWPLVISRDNWGQPVYAEALLRMPETSHFACSVNCFDVVIDRLCSDKRFKDLCCDCRRSTERRRVQTWSRTEKCWDLQTWVALVLTCIVNWFYLI